MAVPRELASPVGDSGIDVERLNHHYVQATGVIPVLQNVNLSIAPGGFVSIVGASGCGKTTLLDIVSGLQPVQVGNVQIGGRPPAAGRRDTARMFARDALLPWLTAEQNIDFALSTRVGDKHTRVTRIRRLLEAVGLAGFTRAYPRQMSQGMRQRVALARTFSLESSFIFLDEPFGALDALTKITLQDHLLRLWESSQATVVLVTHDLSEAVALSDRVVVMSSRPGTVLADVPVTLPRPRNVRDLQATSEFHELCAHLWERLRIATL